MIMKREAIPRNKNISRRAIDLVVRLVSGLSRDEIENKRYRQQEIQKKIIDENEQINEVLKQVTDPDGKKKWALVSKKNPDKVLRYYDGEGKPSQDWVNKVERRVKYFEHQNEDVDVIEEAEYQGRKVKLNDPFRLPTGSDRKFAVYVKNDKGNVVKVQFGDPNAEIKRDDPGRRASFRARHQCDTDPGPKWKARYWSCKMWEKGKTVSELD